MDVEVVEVVFPSVFYDPDGRPDASFSKEVPPGSISCLVSSSYVRPPPHKSKPPGPVPLYSPTREYHQPPRPDPPFDALPVLARQDPPALSP